MKAMMAMKAKTEPCVALLLMQNDPPGLIRLSMYLSPVSDYHSIEWLIV